MFTKEAIEQLQLAGAIDAANRPITEMSVMALPAYFNLHHLEKYNQQRDRMRGIMTTPSLESFTKFVETYTSQDDEYHKAGCRIPVFIWAEQMRAVAILNMGNRYHPGHCDHRAEYAPQPTSAFVALRKHINVPMTQQAVAEFVEDWGDHIQCLDETGLSIGNPAAVQAIRKITIEALSKVESTQQQLSAERSEFEKVAVIERKSLPTHFVFRCAPYADFDGREFRMRLTISTADKAPKLTLRMVAWEKHLEEMADELCGKVREATKILPVDPMVGEFAD